MVGDKAQVLNMCLNITCAIWTPIQCSNFNRMKFTTAIVLSLMLVISCTKPAIKPGEGFVNVKGGKIWYRLIGEGEKTPLLMLHGGPGYPSYYLNPLLPLGKERPVIIFDQLGCGRSDRISDTTLMTIDHHMQQIDKLLSALNVKEFYLYGHSWGTMLGTDYYLKNGNRIKGLILASPCLDAEIWVRDSDALISTLPDSIQVILRNDVRGVMQDSSTLSSAIRIYADNFYTRKLPRSQDVDSSDAQIGYSVYHYMWGPTEFNATGTLRNYDRTADLHKIKAPTLYITGQLDVATPNTVQYYQSLTPHSELKIISNAGHMTMHDNPSEDLQIISKFLRELDATN
jgi:proline iminopeptidase